VQGATDLQIVSNNCGVDGAGLGLLLNEHRICRVVASHIAENQEFARQYLARNSRSNSPPRAPWPNACAPAAPASWRSSRRPASELKSLTAACRGATAPTAPIAFASPAKETRVIAGQLQLLEEAIVTDFARTGRGLPLQELAPSVDLAGVQAATGTHLDVADHIQPMLY
jgi:3-oxoacid CoA-transferase subunit A